MFAYHTPIAPPTPSPHPDLILLQARRDNLVRYNGRLVREIEELTRRIEEELSKLTAADAAEIRRCTGALHA